MTPEQIRNQCEDDADRAPCDLTVWRDRGVIIAAQQTRIAQLEAQQSEVIHILTCHERWNPMGREQWNSDIREALS